MTAAPQPSSSPASVKSPRPFTLAHVTHEAVEKIGGIGTVLEGMIASRVYRSAVNRSILVGPMGGHHFQSPMRRLGDAATVLYSSIDGIDTASFARKLHPVEWAFGVRIAYGRRRFAHDDIARIPDSSCAMTADDPSAEILLVDVSNPSQDRLNAFKRRLWDSFTIDAARFQSDWAFEEYCRLAEPAFYALAALLSEDDWPCIIVSHEFMGLCTAFKAVLDGGDDFRTVFYAHECSTARRVVESLPGHDTAFYNIMRRAAADNLFVEDVFGPQTAHMRHALVSRTHLLDARIAVGDETADELRFLNRDMHAAPIDVVYNGIPIFFADLAAESRSRALLDDWAHRVVGFRPDFLLTHVTRPVVSKGLWRDLKVAASLDAALRADGRRALLIFLACGAAPRSCDDVNRMARAHQWPLRHVEGYPDLVGPEIELNRLIESFNAGHETLKAVLVNQFGWSRATLGDAAPESMSFADLRRATDVEFGQSVYEPFGIAHLEPLGSGAICIPSSVCGCVSAYTDVLRRLGMHDDGPPLHPNIIVADYIRLESDADWPLPRLLKMSQIDRDLLEEKAARQTASTLIDRLPRSPAARERLLHSGQDVARHMNWDSVIADRLLPILARITNSPARVARTASPSPPPFPSHARST